MSMTAAVIDKKEAKKATAYFSVDQGVLLAALERIVPAVDKKSSDIPVLKCVLIEAQGDSVTLTATDLEVGLRTSFPVRSQGESFSLALPARRLVKYLRLVPEGPIRIKQSGKLSAKLSWGRAEVTLDGMPVEYFPTLPKVPEPIARVPVALLARMVSSCLFAISADEARFTLNGALLVLKQDGLTMVGSDGCRLACAEAPIQLGATGSFLLPNKTLRALADKPFGDAAISGDGDHVFFTFDDAMLISRKVSGKFPDYERNLRKEFAYTIPINAPQLEAILERVSQFADQRSDCVRLTFAKDTLTVRSGLSEMGSASEQLPVSYAHDDLEVALNARYLLDGLRFADERDIEFCLTDSLQACEMRFADARVNMSWRYVVMPVRIWQTAQRVYRRQKRGGRGRSDPRAIGGGPWLRKPKSSGRMPPGKQSPPLNG